MAEDVRPVQRESTTTDWILRPRRTWLVTGGCGFIGSHLVDALLARRDEVCVLDDLSTGRSENLSPGARLIRADVADCDAVRAAMDRIDGCFHLAAVASVERANRDWVGTHRTNLTGTVAVLDAARRNRIPVVYASSAAVYGAAGDPPLSETGPTRPLTAYGADKLGCELHARVAKIVHGVRTVGLRFFNVYGPRQDPFSPYSGVISIFCDRIRAGQTVTLHGNGRQTRDFVYVADVARALMLAMARLPEGAPVINVCTGRGISIRELAKTIAALDGRRLVASRAPARLGDLRASIGDPSLARRALDFEARTTLREGLHRTWEALRVLPATRSPSPRDVARPMTDGEHAERADLAWERRA